MPWCHGKRLGSQRQSLNNIRDQLIMLIMLSGDVEAPPAVANAVVAPLNPQNTTTIDSSLQLLVSSQETTQKDVVEGSVDLFTN